MDLNKKIRKKYLGVTFIVLLVLTFFQISNVVIGGFGNNLTTQVGTKVKMNDLDITLVGSGYSKEKNEYKLAFTIPTDQTNPLVDLKIFAKADKISNDYLVSDTEKIFEDLFIATIKLPKNKWKKIGYEVTAVAVDTEPQLSANEKFYLYKNSLTEDKTLTVEQAKSTYIEEKISLAEGEIKSAEKQIDNLNIEIEKLKQANIELENSKKDLPEVDQMTIQNKIGSNESEAKQKQTNIEKLGEEIELNKERIASYNVQKSTE